MATKPITLIPGQYAFMDNDGSFTSWRGYSNQRVSLDKKRGCAFRFFINREATLSNIRVNYSISSQFVYGDIKIHATSRSVISKNDGSLIRSYDGSGTVTGSDSYSGTLDFDGSNYLYIIITANGGYDDVSINSLSVSATLEADIPALTITGISPNPAIAGSNATISFGNRNGHPLTVEISSGDISLATYYNVDEDDFTLPIDVAWLSGKNEIEVVVKATDSTDELFSREVTAKFKVQNEPIGVELAQIPTYSGPNSNINVTFKNRKGHSLYLTVQGAAKGSSNKITIVSRYNITSEITNEKFTIVADDEWFENINGNEMTVYLEFEDTTWSRKETPNFILKAGDGTKPTIGDVELSSYIYPQSDADILEDAGYTGFIAGYSYVNVRVSTEAKGGSQFPTVIAKWSGKTFTLNYDGPDPQDDTRLIYSGTTDRKITSKSDALFTVTVTNAKQRSTDKDAYIYAKDITVLPNIGLTQQGTIYAEDSFYISPTGCIGDYRYIIKTANYEITTSQWRSEPTRVLTTYVGYFKNSGQAGLPSINLNITITDELGRSANFTFVVLAPLPQILSFSYVHVPDDRIPESASVQPTKADVVSGYSKINFTAKVRWYCEPGSVVVKDQSNNANTLSLASNYSSTTFPKDADYSYTSDNVISTTYSQLIYTLTAKDTGVITSGMYRRTGDTLSSKITIPIYRLQNMTVTPPSTVDTDAQATIRVNNFVGSYAYEAKIANDTVSESEEPIITPTFSVFADPAWFESASTPTLTVYVTVEDVLGRTQTVSFTVRLNRFVLTLTPTGDIQIDGTIQISVEGSGSQQVAIVLTTPKGGETLELASTTATTTSPATVTCPRTWFTDHSEFDNVYQLPVTVTASYAGRSTSQSFKLVYPALGLTLQKTDGSGDVATEAEVGENVLYGFTHQEGEDVSVHYYYSNLTTPIRSLGPYSESSATIATPQLFDDANANTVQTMKVSVVISDKRGRTARVDNFTVKVNELMHPYVSSFSVTPLNPSTIVKEDLKNKFIENVSKFRVSIVFAPQTKAAMKPESVYVVLCRGYEWNEDTGRREYEGVYGRYQMKPVAGEINKYLFESDFTIPVFNKRFVVDKNGIMKGGSVLVIEAQDQRQMSAYLNRWMSWIGMQPDIYMYSLPRATDIHYHRCNQDETPNDAGEYCHVAIDYQFTGFWNSLLPPTAYNVGRVSATLDSETQYEDLPFSTSGGEPNPQSPDVPDTGTVEFTFDDVSMERTYDITITLSDLITSTTYTVRLSTAGVIMDFLHDGKGLALGKVAEHQGMVEVNPEWTFQSEKMKVRVKDGTDDKGMYDIGQLLCQILNRMNNGGL